MRSQRGLATTAAMLGLGLLTLTSAVRCTSETPADERGPVLTDLARTVMLPTVETFAASAAPLTAALDAFCDAPDQARLDAAQDAWRAARAPWEHTQAILFGPAEELGSANALDFWPVRTDNVESAIAEAPATVTPDHVAALGVSVRGLSTLDYLLFDPAGGDATVLTTLGGDDPDAMRRCSFAVAISGIFERDVSALADAWRPESGAFVEQVATAGSGSDTFPRAQDGIDRVVNTLVELLQKVTDGRLGAPSGTRTGGTPQPDLVESRFSDNSIADLIEATRGIEAVYTGRFGTTEGRGLATLLERSPDLDTSIRNQLTDFISKLESIPAPLSEAVTTDPTSVAAALESGRALRRLIAVDLAGILNVTVTLNDNDGD
ncbi:imelysin family protein [Chondromyces apiculatus]|nr:imelysin family protein [Chondromyces apiculatus]